MTGRRPQGQGTRSDTTREQVTAHGPRRGRNVDRGAVKEDATAGTRAHTQERHATTEGPLPPHPQQTRRGPRRRTPPTLTAAARIGRRTDHTGSCSPASRNHTEQGGHTHTGRRGCDHRRRGPERHRAAHYHALTARRRRRSQQGSPHRHQKRKRARPQRPGLEARTPRGHGTKAQTPREGNPMDTHLTSGPERHTRTFGARVQRATPHLAAPPSHQPATLRPALRTTTRAGLTTTGPQRHNTRQHGTPHRSAPPCDAPRESTPRHNRPQHDAARRSTVRHTTASHGATRRDTTRRTAAQHGATRRSTAKHSTTQVGAPQHTTTPEQGTPTKGQTRQTRRTPRKAPHQPTTHRQGATARPATTMAVCQHKTPPED